QDKVYDGTTAATLNVNNAALVGKLLGDTVTLNTNAAVGTFATKNISNNITVTVSGLTIGGTDAGNYSLTQPTTTASIFGEMTPPTVTLNSPNGGQTFTVGTATVITWSATDNLTPAASLVLTLQYSTNGGTTWASVAGFDGINDGAFSWTVPATASTTCLVRLTATDAAGNLGADTSDAVFTIAAVSVPPTPVTTINLTAGWNLVSLTQIPTDPTIGSVLTGISANVISVWYYDASTSTWLSYDGPAGAPDTLTTMTDGKGYWVNMAMSATLTITGSDLPAPPATPPTYNVVVGWNLIGFKSTASMTASEYLAGITGGYTRIYRFDGTNYIIVRTTDNLTPGAGYWIAVTGAGTIYP
ncbi:hypothetical protein DEALK_02670, partial [Dehalogenimonas alkenigignens]